MNRPEPNGSCFRASSPSPRRDVTAIVAAENDAERAIPSWAFELRDRSILCHRCLRCLDCSCCCEADCCFPDYRSRSERSALPILPRPAESLLSSFFTSFLFWNKSNLMPVEVVGRAWMGHAVCPMKSKTPWLCADSTHQSARADLGHWPA